MYSSSINVRLRLSQKPAALALALALTFPLPAVAQTTPNQPDAGRALDSVRPQPAPTRPAPSIEIQPENRPALKRDSSFRTRVNQVRITGNSVFPEATLQEVVKSLVGKDASLADLEAAGTAITRFYRENGYFVARAYLPQQEIKDGIVEIAILEGRYADITVNGPGNRIAKSAAQGYLGANLRKGEVVAEPGLERAMLLMNDFPAVDVKSVLRPGTAVGTANLEVTANEGNLRSGFRIP